MPPAEARVQRFEARDRATVQTKFLKTDRPRAIDRYIDYFGGGSAVSTTLAETDLCGERFLDVLTEQVQRVPGGIRVSPCRRNDNLSRLRGDTPLGFGIKHMCLSHLAALLLGGR